MDDNKNESSELASIESAKYVVLGNVDAGKSSFISVMEKNVLDNGNGSARKLITKYKHELESGKTSSQTPHYIVKNNEITTLIDLCGHFKYLKTTINGVTGSNADYGIVMVGANMGLVGTTNEHLMTLLTVGIPFIIIVTKIDICPDNIMDALKKNISKIAKQMKKQVMFFEDAEEKINGTYIKEKHTAIIELFQKGIRSMIPIVMVSNKTGHNIKFVREFLTTIKPKSYLLRKGLIQEEINKNNYPMVMYIDTTFNVPGIGLVLSGCDKFKPIQLGQKLYVGPINNQYISVTVKTMKNPIRENITVINPNESGTIGIRIDSKGTYNREMFLKGQIVTDNYDFAIKNTFRKFNCDVRIFNHSTTIKNGYETVINCETIRQTAKFKISDDTVLRSDLTSKHNIEIMFKQRSEFILPETIFVFTEGKMMGRGIINCGVNSVTDEIKIKKSKRARLKMIP